MKTIWKYEVEIRDLDEKGVKHVQVPLGAEIVHVTNDGDPEKVTFWASVDTARPQSTIRLLVTGTGHPVPDGTRYVGTAVTSIGLVWHLWEVFGEL